MHKHGCSNSELGSQSKVLPMESQMGGHGRRPGESSLCLIDTFSVRLMVVANLDIAESSTHVFLLQKLPKLSIIDEVIYESTNSTDPNGLYGGLSGPAR